MRTDPLPFSSPLIGSEEIEEVIQVLRSNWLTTGPRTKRFEEEFATLIGAPEALALSSCTAALHLALITLGIGSNDLVITTPLTFCSSVNVIEHVGAQPVFVDVEPETLNIDPMKVKEAVEISRGPNPGSLKQKNGFARRNNGNARIKAVLPVHLYGHPCDMDTLLQVIHENDLALVEDAAHALFAEYKKHMVGSACGTLRSRHLTCFSFYVTKNITTAEGGMLVGTSELLSKARMLSQHGINRDAWKRHDSQQSWYYEVMAPGFKYNMTDIQAAIGSQQLSKLEGFQARRREIVQRYNEVFSQLEQLQIPRERAEVKHSWHLYVLRLNLGSLRICRNQFIEELKERKIGTSVHFIPIHLQPYYRTKYGFEPNDFPVAYREYKRIISLPLYPGMSDQDVDDVITAVFDTVAKFKK